MTADRSIHESVRDAYASVAKQQVSCCPAKTPCCPKDAEPAPYADLGLSCGNPVEDAFLRAVRYARPPWGARVETYELCEGLGREMMEDIQYGGVPVETAMRRTAKLMDAVLTEH